MPRYNRKLLYRLYTQVEVLPDKQDITKDGSCDQVIPYRAIIYLDGLRVTLRNLKMDPRVKPEDDVGL